jgi:hypothetical protein
MTLFVIFLYYQPLVPAVTTDLCRGLINYRWCGITRELNSLDSHFRGLLLEPPRHVWGSEPQTARLGR